MVSLARWSQLSRAVRERREKTSAGPLALKRELREISQLEKTKQQELTAAQNQLAELEREIGGLSEHLEVLRHRQQSQEKDVLALDHETKKLAEEFQRANTRLSSARLELDRVKRERGQLERIAHVVRSTVGGKGSGASRSGRRLLNRLAKTCRSCKARWRE